MGAGPAGINCAYHLLRRGYRVDIFEQEAHAGGMARIGIPAYRLPNKLLETETDVITRLGGNYKFGQAFGRDFTIDELFHRGYKAVFLGIGCALGQYLGLPGEDTTAKGDSTSSSTSSTRRRAAKRRRLKATSWSWAAGTSPWTAAARRAAF